MHSEAVKDKSIRKLKKNPTKADLSDWIRSLQEEFPSLESARGIAEIKQVELYTQ